MNYNMEIIGNYLVNITIILYYYEKIMVFSTNLLTVLKYWHILLADLKSEC